MQHLTSFIINNDICSFYICVRVMILPFVKKYPLTILTTLFFSPNCFLFFCGSEQSQVKPEVTGTLLCIQREQLGLEEGKTYPWIPDSCPGTPHRWRYHLYEFFRKCTEVFGQGKGSVLREITVLQCAEQSPQMRIPCPTRQSTSREKHIRCCSWI